MTDLERVREALLDRKRMTEAWLPEFTDGALTDLDAHLKEDAERERYRDVAVRGHSRCLDDLMRAEAELARLREELAARPKVYFPQEDVSKLLAERDKLREENKQLRRAYESDAEAIEQAAENARLRENQCLICEYPADHDQQLCVTELARLREENDRLREKLAEAVARLEDADHHWREIHGVHTHEAML